MNPYEPPVEPQRELYPPEMPREPRGLSLWMGSLVCVLLFLTFLFIALLYRTDAQ